MSFLPIYLVICRHDVWILVYPGIVLASKLWCGHVVGVAYVGKSWSIWRPNAVEALYTVWMEVRDILRLFRVICTIRISLIRPLMLLARVAKARMWKPPTPEALLKRSLLT